MAAQRRALLRGTIPIYDSSRNSFNDYFDVDQVQADQESVGNIGEATSIEDCRNDSPRPMNQNLAGVEGPTSTVSDWRLVSDKRLAPRREVR
jgi:hypothetical protein